MKHDPRSSELGELLMSTKHEYLHVPRDTLGFMSATLCVAVMAGTRDAMVATRAKMNTRASSAEVVSEAHILMGRGLLASLWMAAINRRDPLCGWYLKTLLETLARIAGEPAPADQFGWDDVERLMPTVTAGFVESAIAGFDTMIRERSSPSGHRH